MTKDIIDVVIIDDSPTVRAYLTQLLGSQPDMRVVGSASNGRNGVAMVNRLRPDVVTMDVYMPDMNGFEATREIMASTPTPIVIATSTWSPADVTMAFNAVEAGAVTILQKPAGPGHPDHARSAREVVRTVRLMAEVPVARRWATVRDARGVPSHSVALPPPAPLRNVEVVAIGASTGGPAVLQTILKGLPKALPVPMLVVQHIAAGFDRGLVDWLTQTTGIPVHLSQDGVRPLAGHAYVARTGAHMGITKKGVIAASDDPPEHGSRPSVSYLFRSVAENMPSRAVGVLLTGMGADGAAELRLLKDGGAVTIAQDRESSVVHGMPGAAIKLDGATYILPPADIVGMLVALVKAPPPAGRDHTIGVQNGASRGHVD